MRTTPRSLRDFQQQFASALAEPLQLGSSLASLQGQPGFAVYRNTVALARVDALVRNYPAVRRLVGEQWMRDACAAYAASTPPCDPSLLHYGRGFDDFLQRWRPSDTPPYLPAIAALDRCWTECYAGDDADTLDAAALAALPPAALAEQTLRLHPALRWHWCEEHPARTIWERNRRSVEKHDIDENADLVWHGEGLFFTRPSCSAAVQWQAVDRAGNAFLLACSRGFPLGEAAGLALEADPACNVAALLSDLLCAGAFCGASAESRAP